MAIKKEKALPGAAELGDRVVDRVTGHRGVVVQITENLNGCMQCTVRPPVDKDGKMIEAWSIDIENLDVLERNAAKVVRKTGAQRTGGADSKPARQA